LNKDYLGIRMKQKQTSLRISPVFQAMMDHFSCFTKLFICITRIKLNIVMTELSRVVNLTNNNTIKTTKGLHI